MKSNNETGEAGAAQQPLVIEDIRRVFREELIRVEGDKLLTAEDACAAASISFPTLKKWAGSGRLPVHEIGPGIYRYKKSDVLTAAERKHQKSLTNN